MLLVELEMLFYPFGQAQNLLFGEGQSHDLHAHWQSGRPVQALLHCRGDVIVPGTLVFLLIGPHNSDRSHCRWHSQQVPNDSVFPEERCVVGYAVVWRLCAEGRTEHKVQVLAAPKGDPLLF